MLTTGSGQFDDEGNDLTAGPSGKLSLRALKLCFFAIQHFHFHFSMLTPPDKVQGTSGVNNLFSQKESVKAIRSFFSFDQIAFRNQHEKIRSFQMCTMPQNWMIAVQFSRVLHIYDQITGAQVFELCVPSAKSFSLIDNEQCLVVWNGYSSVLVANIAS
jgi:hypothetical protein